MKNREFLLLAKTYKGQNVEGWYASEKLDGMRAFWDGGTTRGKPTHSVPWANLDKAVSPESTGLWTRYGNVIHAPGWWLDKLPPIPLDGELYVGRGCFQKTISICRTYRPDERWHDVKYHIFDMPGHWQFACQGRINNPNFSRIIDEDRVIATFGTPLPPSVFLDVVREMKTYANDIVIPCEQVIIPNAKALGNLMATVLDAGGEGLVLRDPHSVWIPYRTDFLLKVKGFLDAEATVLGYISGQGKLLGLMGALIVDFGGTIFELSGFTDNERRLSDVNWCYNNPGKEVPDWITSDYFPRGSSVTFRYRELTNDGVPKEARYLR